MTDPRIFNPHPSRDPKYDVRIVARDKEAGKVKVGYVNGGPSWWVHDNVPEAWGEVAAARRQKIMDEQIRVSILADAIRHVLRYGRVGKQSERRLRAALFAVKEQP